MNAEGVLQARRFPVLVVACGWALALVATASFLGHDDFDVKFGRAFIQWAGVFGVVPPLLLVSRDLLAVEDGNRPLADVFFYFIFALLGFGLAYFAMGIGNFQIDGMTSPWGGRGDQFHNSPKLDLSGTGTALVDSLFISCRGLLFQGLTLSIASPLQKLLAVVEATTSFGIILLAVKSLGRRRAG